MTLSVFQPLRIRFATILTAIRDQVVATAVVPYPSVQIVATDAPPKTTGQQLIFIRARRPMVVESNAKSAGRVDTRVTRTVDVYVVNRASLDKVNSDETWLTVAGRSYFDIEEDVLSAFQDWTPTDSDGNALTCHDIHVTSGEAPDMDARALGWGQASLSLEVVYMPPLKLVDIASVSAFPSTLTVGTAASITFTATGNGGMPVVDIAGWSLNPSAMTLPAGLSLSSSTGAISGTPTTAGNGPSTTAVITIQVADTVSGVAGWRRYVLPVAIQITGTLSGGTHGVVYTPQTLVAVGATGAVVWSIAAVSGSFGGTLPPGLVLNASTGVVSGTPTTAGTSAFTVLVTDSKGNTGTGTFTVVIA